MLMKLHDKHPGPPDDPEINTLHLKILLVQDSVKTRQYNNPCNRYNFPISRYLY